MDQTKPAIQTKNARQQTCQCLSRRDGVASEDVAVWYMFSKTQQKSEFGDYGDDGGGGGGDD
jgi:hypothetical protein